LISLATSLFVALSLLLAGDAQMLMEDRFYIQPQSFISSLLWFFTGSHQKGEQCHLKTRLAKSPHACAILSAPLLERPMLVGM